VAVDPEALEVIEVTRVLVQSARQVGTSKGVPESTIEIGLPSRSPVPAAATRSPGVLRKRRARQSLQHVSRTFSLQLKVVFNWMISGSAV